jgi:phage tail protein X
VSAFDPPLDGLPGLRRPRDITTPPGVIEHTLAAGERLDLLAYHYYGDARRWRRILDANPQLLGAHQAEQLAQGATIAIPRGDG